MPDYEAEFQEAVASALRRLRSREEPATFTDKVSGVTIKGWEFRDYYRKDGPYYDGPWEESSDVFRVLDEHGSIWETQDYSRELHQPPWTYERRNILVRCGESTLVGNEGKPFSEWLAKVERLGY